jgi:prepilin-type N-terminal cleavage/methylation domain-containing protein
MFNAIHRARSQKGFTLIELLIVVAIIGIIAAILIPNLLDALQKAKQKRTVGDMRSIGSAWFSWLTDQVGAAAAGTSNTYDYTGGLTQSISAGDLLTTLFVSTSMFYIQEVPENDGWGNPFDYRWSGNVLSAQVVGMCSQGRDASGCTGSYSMGPFNATQYEEDIVWADGFFIRYPAGAKTQ